MGSRYKTLKNKTKIIMDNYLQFEINENYKNDLKYHAMHVYIDGIFNDLKKTEVYVLKKHFIDHEAYKYCGYSRANYYKNLKTGMERITRRCKIYTQLIK
ncbi:MAG: hypothetical protein LBB95_02505 [Mycoplasmataceae bacterium]|jgi:hypothetical protein|nr:hypothetical protein [Mycoplasmataceae bacterium]